MKLKRVVFNIAKKALLEPNTIVQYMGHIDFPKFEGDPELGKFFIVKGDYGGSYYEGFLKLMDSKTCEDIEEGWNPLLFRKIGKYTSD